MKTTNCFVLLRSLYSFNTTMCDRAWRGFF